MLNGGSFVALIDEPGACPGEGWQLWAKQGKAGQKGDRGAVGPRGEPGKVIRVIGGQIDPERMELVLLHTDGEPVSIDVTPLADVIRRSL